MAFRAPPLLCADAAYQKYLPLQGFIPAIHFCSDLAVHQKYKEFAAASLNLADSSSLSADWQCPEGSSVCSLLSDLEAEDKSVTHNAWYIDLTGEESEGLALTHVLVAA